MGVLKKGNKGHADPTLTEKNNKDAVDVHQKSGEQKMAKRKE